VNISDPITIDGEHVDRMAAPVCVDIDFWDREPLFEEGERGIVIVPSNADSRPGRLFLPLDGEMGCNLGDGKVASLEVSAPVVRDYPLYRLKIEARFSLRL